NDDEHALHQIGTDAVDLVFELPLRHLHEGRFVAERAQLPVIHDADVVVAPLRGDVRPFAEVEVVRQTVDRMERRSLAYHVAGRKLRGALAQRTSEDPVDVRAVAALRLRTARRVPAAERAQPAPERGEQKELSFEGL